MGLNTGNSGIFSYTANMPLFSPADATTYFIGDIYQTTNPVTSALFRTKKYPFSTRLVAAMITSNCNQVGVTQENSTVSVRINDTTDILLSNAVQFNNAQFNFYPVTGLNTILAANDFFEIKWLTPTWVTNPTNTVIRVDLYFRPV